MSSLALLPPSPPIQKERERRRSRRGRGLEKSAAANDAEIVLEVVTRRRQIQGSGRPQYASQRGLEGVHELSSANQFGGET